MGASVGGSAGAAFDGGIWTRPIDLLHQLSLATWFVHYHPTVFDAYFHWAVLRYIGAFDIPVPRSPNLHLSRAAQRVTGNQRRVLSEDLGIATAVLLARKWFANEYPGVALNVVDIDVAVELHLIEKPPGRRADYLLTGVDPASQRLFAYGLLESKGSSSSPHHRTQVARGAAQLEATTVAGERLPGLIAALLAGTDLRYEAAEIVPVPSRGPVDFCAASLAVLAPVVLARVSEPWWATAAVTAGFIILARASYIAAIASARGYVVALKEMDAYA